MPDPLAPRDGGYCEVDDLLIGDLPLSNAIDPEKFIYDTADEIDATVGERYVTPFVLANLNRVSILTLKMINVRLASGRLLLAQAQGSQDTVLNAYGKSLLDEGMNALMSLKSGSIIIEGDPNGLDPDFGPIVDDSDLAGPDIINVDQVSQVDDFFGNFSVGGPIWGPHPEGVQWPPL